MNARLTILSTRKIRPAIRQLAELWGIEVIDQDFVELTYKQDGVFTRGDVLPGSCLVFTSKHAVQAYIENTQQHGLAAADIFCLRSETVLALQHFNTIRTITFAENVATLAATITDNRKLQHVHIIRGNEGSADLAGKLKAAGLTVKETEAYQVVNKGRRIHDAFQAILFFSPECVESFFQTNLLPRSVTCFCGSVETAATLGMYTGNTGVILTNTSPESMLQSINEYFFTKKKTRANDRNSLVPGNG